MISTQTTAQLFAGQPEPFGGLSNENELTKACPPEFKKDNPWSDYAMKLFYRGGSIANWKWKFGDEAERRQQKACFTGFLGTFGVSHEDKKAVADWMLSEMLTEVPEYVPGKKN